MPLDLAVVKAVDDLLSSQQRYKVMKAQNIGLSVAKGVFHPNFAGGVALHALIKEAKSWLRKNVFSPIEILKQMDLRGGTLNYEGIGVLNDVESAAMAGGKDFSEGCSYTQLFTKNCQSLRRAWTEALSA
jgi:butyrate kinase